MARVELLCTVDKIVASNLQPVSGASVNVKLRSTGNPVTVYAAEVGGTTVTNPLVTDANGRINGWVDEASLILTISGAGITTYNQPYEAVRGDGVMNIAAGVVDVTKLASAVADALFKPGDIKLSAKGSADSGFLLCQGQTVSRTTYAALFAAIGTAFNTGGEAGTDFRLPDLRSRVPIGPDASAGLIGSNNVLGSRGGEASHVLITAETPSHTHTGGAHTHTGGAHTHADTFAVASTSFLSGGFPWLVTANGSVSYQDATGYGGLVNTVPIRVPASGIYSVGSTTSTLYTHQSSSHLHTLSGSVSSGGAVATTSAGAVATTATGGDGGHNNIQPYTVVNFQIKT